MTNIASDRSDVRLLLGFKALFYTNTVEGSAVVANLSQGGAFLVTRANLRLGHSVRLLVLLGNGGRQELSGSVVRRDTSGFAVRFDESREEAGRLVRNIKTIVNTRAAEATADRPALTRIGGERHPVPALV